MGLTIAIIYFFSKYLSKTRSNVCHIKNYLKKKTSNIIKKDLEVPLIINDIFFNTLNKT